MHHQPNTGKKPKFPLPRGYFGEVQFSKHQVQFYREFCQNQVQRALLDEKLHDRSQRRVDNTKWKPVRSQHAFQLFRRRDGGLHENDGKPSMLGVGCVEGSIEDVIYGAYDQTDEELRMTAELVDVDFGDGIVLNNMEHGLDHDPYRYLGVKWILTPFPMPTLMPDRDWVLLESAGIARDADGRRYGYHTLFTVDLPQCPLFPEVIRGEMWYTFIFRDAGRGMIDVHSQGYFDCKGELLDPFTVIGSTQMFNGVFRYMKSSEAKKLTILALENLEHKVAAGLPPTSDESALGPTAVCSICTKHRSSIPFSSRRMRVCRVCDNVVCLNCRVKKNILIGRQRVMSKVSVCQKCIAHAKSLVVEPASEKYVISREMQLGSSRAEHLGHGWSSSSSTAFHTTGGHQALGTLRSRLGSAGYTTERSGVPLSARSKSAMAYDDEAAPRLHTRPPRPASSSHEDGGISLRSEPQLSGRKESASPPPIGAAVSQASAASNAINTASRPHSLGDPVESTSEAASSDQQTALLAKMRQLQESARRAHDLTQASRQAMVDNNVGGLS